VFSVRIDPNYRSLSVNIYPISLWIAAIIATQFVKHAGGPKRWA
jgi:hypothetical protein